MFWKFYIWVISLRREEEAQDHSLLCLGSFHSRGRRRRWRLWLLSTVSAAWPLTALLQSCP
jgi:hypothetical protein